MPLRGVVTVRSVEESKMTTGQTGEVRWGPPRWRGTCEKRTRVYSREVQITGDRDRRRDRRLTRRASLFCLLSLSLILLPLLPLPLLPQVEN